MSGKAKLKNRREASYFSNENDIRFSFSSHITAALNVFSPFLNPLITLVFPSANNFLTFACEIDLPNIVFEIVNEHFVFA